MRLVLLSSVLAGLMLSVSTGAGAEDGLPMFRGAPQLTGVYGTQTPRRLRGVRFQFDTRAPLRNAAVVDRGRLYVGAADGKFYGLDAHTGAELWHANLTTSVTSTAAVVADAVLFTTRDNVLHALAARDGHPLWSMSLGVDKGTQNYWDFFTSAPIPFDGIVYVGSGDGAVYAIDPQTQHVIWRADVGARIRATPAVSASTIVIGAQNGYVYGLDRRTGSQRWRFATDGVRHDFAFRDNDTTSVFASATIANGIAAVGGRDGQLYGLDIETGEKRWKTTHDGGSWMLSTGADDGVLYVGGGSASIVQAADMATGHERWRFAVDGAVFGSLSVSGGAVLFDDFGGTLHAVDRGNGHELWRFAMGDRSFSTPVIADGIVYVASDAGVLYALDASDGAPPPEVKRYVFLAGGETWYPAHRGEAIAGGFNAQHYESVDEPALLRVMSEQIAHTASSAIVFADNTLPASVREGNNAHSLLRRYLEAGGVVVFLSQNPASFHYDEHGVIDEVDEALTTPLLDLHYAPRPVDYGYHVSLVTARGERWGLHGAYVANGVIPDDQVTIVLGRDEFGYASTWVRAYGADHAGLLIQLAVPRNRTVDVTSDVNAIELALASRFGG